MQALHDCVENCDGGMKWRPEKRHGLRRPEKSKQSTPQLNPAKWSIIFFAYLHLNEKWSTRVEARKLLCGIQLVLDADLVVRDCSDDSCMLLLVISVPGINSPERCLIRWHRRQSASPSLSQEQTDFRKFRLNALSAVSKGFYLPACFAWPHMHEHDPRSDVLPCHAMPMKRGRESGETA